MARGQKAQSNDQGKKYSGKDDVCAERADKVEGAEEAHEQREESEGGMEFCSIGAIGPTTVVVRRKGGRET
jgi:hypothetical protein